MENREINIRGITKREFIFVLSDIVGEMMRQTHGDFVQIWPDDALKELAIFDAFRNSSRLTEEERTEKWEALIDEAVRRNLYAFRVRQPKTERGGGWPFTQLTALQ